jgi:hypothetical protein
VRSSASALINKVILSTGNCGKSTSTYHQQPQKRKMEYKQYQKLKVYSPEAVIAGETSSFSESLPMSEKNSCKSIYSAEILFS